MQDMLSKEHHCYRHHISVLKSSASCFSFQVSTILTILAFSLKKNASAFFSIHIFQLFFCLIILFLHFSCFNSFFLACLFYGKPQYHFCSHFFKYLTALRSLFSLNRNIFSNSIVSNSILFKSINCRFQSTAFFSQIFSFFLQSSGSLHVNYLISQTINGVNIVLL